MTIMRRLTGCLIVLLGVGCNQIRSIDTKLAMYWGKDTSSVENRIRDDSIESSEETDITSSLNLSEEQPHNLILLPEHIPTRSGTFKVRLKACVSRRAIKDFILDNGRFLFIIAATSIGYIFVEPYMTDDVYNPLPFKRWASDLIYGFSALMHIFRAIEMFKAVKLSRKSRRFCACYHILISAIAGTVPIQINFTKTLDKGYHHISYGTLLVLSHYMGFTFSGLALIGDQIYCYNMFHFLSKKRISCPKNTADNLVVKYWPTLLVVISLTTVVEMIGKCVYKYFYKTEYPGMKKPNEEVELVVRG